jgi:hypothetical protein
VAGSTDLLSEEFNRQEIDAQQKHLNKHKKRDKPPKFTGIGSDQKMFRFKHIERSEKPRGSRYSPTIKKVD